MERKLQTRPPQTTRATDKMGATCGCVFDVNSQTSSPLKLGSSSRIVNIELTHFQQRYNWDCGIACVSMILPQQKRRNLIDNFNDICAEEGFHKSTWSIDLCYLLQRYDVSHMYCTLTLGVHPDYVNQHFYDKILLKDEVRVTKKFAEAAANGLNIRKTSVTDDDLLRHLAECGPIILLVNVSLLKCQTCHGSKWLTEELKACLPWISTSGCGDSVEYRGHYIVLCGFNIEEQTYSYRNPTYKDKVCSIAFSALTEARKSHGTDEDTILIFTRTWL